MEWVKKVGLKLAGFLTLLGFLALVISRLMSSRGKREKIIDSIVREKEAIDAADEKQRTAKGVADALEGRAEGIREAIDDRIETGEVKGDEDPTDARADLWNRRVGLRDDGTRN